MPWSRLLLAGLAAGVLLTACANKIDGEPGAAGLDDPYFAELGNGGYDVDRYDIAVRYHPRLPEIEATTTIEATATADLSSFNFDLIGLTVDSVTVDDKEAEISRTETELTVTPDDAIAQGDTFTVAIEYHGEPTTGDLESTPIENGWIRLDSGATYVLAEPDGARTWFPNNDHPSDKATYTFHIAVPDGVEVAANGRLESDTLGDDGYRTWHWEMDEPMATYLATVAIGDYEIQHTASPNGVTIRNFFLSAEYDQAVSDFAVTGEMIDFFSSIFGPYPFDEYGAVTVPILLRSALETQTLSVFGSDAVDGTGGSEAIIAHELAHQWFGDSVTPNDWRDIWLSEGFATYAEALWREHSDPGFDIDAEMARTVDQFGSRLGPIGDPGADNLFDISVYKRGGLTLHALRRTIGDEAFFETLRTWTAEHRHGNATTSEFIETAERISGQKLDDLFATWLHADELPDLPSGRTSPLSAHWMTPSLS